ncbi:UNVERIFIED_CONTAM: hypothetical protein K2H54_013604 [Gekko kuhli]
MDADIDPLVLDVLLVCVAAGAQRQRCLEAAQRWEEVVTASRRRKCAAWARFLIRRRVRARLRAMRMRRRMLVERIWVVQRARMATFNQVAYYLTLTELRASRRWWVYPRSSELWNVYARVIWEDEQWLARFRMTWATFQWLVDCLQPHLEHQVTVMRAPISVEERVAIAIAWLGNTLSYLDVGDRFGVARSTVSGIVIEVCLAIEAHLLRSMVCLRSAGRVSISPVKHKH